MTARQGPAMKPLLATVFTMNLMEFLQSGMIVFAAGPITGEISASPEEYSVISVLYACIAIVSISQMTPMAQRFGWRRYVLGSLAVFIAGALICAGSHDLVSFAVGRAIMAAGGGPLMSIARVLINLIPPSPQRIKGFLAFGSSLTLGLAGAPWIAASMVAHDQWHAMFYLLIAIAVCAGALALRCLPANAATLSAPTSFSFAAAANLLIGSFVTLYALQRASFDYHTGVLPLVAWLIIGLIPLAWFVRLQSGDAAPFLRLRQLVNQRYLFGLGIFTASFFVLGATNVMLPVFIQRGLGVAPEVAGMVQGIGFLGAVVTLIATIMIVQRRPAAKKFYATAFVLLGLFGWSLSTLNGQSNLWTDILPPLVLFGAFLIMTLVTTALNAFRDLQQDEVVFANGQQLKNMLSQFGLGLGVACANVGFQQRVTQHYSVLSERFVTGGAELTARLGPLSEAPAAMQAALAPLAQQLTQQSTLIASIEYFWLLMWFAVVGAVVMLAQRIFH